MKRYILKGRNIVNLNTFLIEFTKALNQKETICTDLFEFDDCLFGYGGLEYPCELIWEEHSISKPFLDNNALIMEYAKLVNAFESTLKKQPNDDFTVDMIEYYRSNLNEAKENGFTLFDAITEMISSVPERNSHCQIKLRLQ